MITENGANSQKPIGGGDLANAMSQSFGQRAVGLSFNPSGDDQVGKAKQICAAAIDQMDTLRNTTTNGEVKRMCSVAITELQTAQMWMVKAITWKD